MAYYSPYGEDLFPAVECDRLNMMTIIFWPTGCLWWWWWWYICICKLPSEDSNLRLPVWEAVTLTTAPRTYNRNFRFWYIYTNSHRNFRRFPLSWLDPNATLRWNICNIQVFELVKIFVNYPGRTRNHVHLSYRQTLRPLHHHIYIYLFLLTEWILKIIRFS